MPRPCPLVSIVTPSFQQARYLRRCIDSVLAQEYPRIEYIVCDGGSTDESCEILRSYGERISWSSGPDGGQAAAINAGLQRARGEIVGFLNSDDSLSPRAVASAVSALTSQPDISIVYGQTTVVDEKGEPRRLYPTQAFNRDVFVEHCFISQPAAFWRRSLHDRLGFFSTEFDHTLDYEFWVRAMVAGVKFLYVEEPWACATEHPEAKSQRLRAQIFAQIRALQLRHLGYCGRNWWEQQLRYWRDESSGVWGRLLPGKKEERLYRLAWWPYVFWRRKLGGPLFYQAHHWRA